MKIGVAIFTYKRSYHTEKVLTALKNNKVLPEKLFLFQDGLKDSDNDDEWNKVNTLIKSVDWCDNEVIVSKRNKGLADSIEFGVDYVFMHYDMIVVLEDDCIPHPEFMTFMVQALNRYQNDKKVYSVSGYSYPVDIPNIEVDAYFTRRISSWGWGTWKDRWVKYSRDYRILGRILNNKELSKQLHIWGEDLECYLLGNVYGNCDSWATFWAYTVIEHKGYCLSPYKSLIKNIGFDGTGVHCGIGEITQYLYEEDICNFRFPEQIEISKECEDIFCDYFSWKSGEKKLRSYNELLIKWITCLMRDEPKIADRLLEKGIKKCSIWGKGEICDLLLEELEGKIQVISIIESNPKVKKYKDIPVIAIDAITNETQLIIVIPIYDFSKIERIVKKIDNINIISLDHIFKNDILTNKSVF